VELLASRSVFSCVSVWNRLYQFSTFRSGKRETVLVRHCSVRDRHDLGSRLSRRVEGQRVGPSGRSRMAYHWAIGVGMATAQTNKKAGLVLGGRRSDAAWRFVWDLRVETGLNCSTGASSTEPRGVRTA
jgi:hypothetical protein